MSTNPTASVPHHANGVRSPMAGAPPTRIEVEADDDDVRPSISDLFSKLYADGEAYARAEVQLVRTQVTHKASSAALGAGLVGGAVVLALATATALLVGLILTLETLVGPGWATLIVVVLSLALAGLLAKTGIARVTAALKGEAK